MVATSAGARLTLASLVVTSTFPLVVARVPCTVLPSARTTWTGLSALSDRNGGDVSRRQADLGILGGHFHFPVGGGKGSLHGFAIRQDDVDRLVGPYRLYLVPGCGDDAEMVGLDGEVLAVLFDDAAGDPVTVLHHHLICPCGAHREADE